MKLKQSVITVFCVCLICVLSLTALLTIVTAAGVPTPVAVTPRVQVDVQNPELRCSVMQAGQYMDETFLEDLFEVSENILFNNLVVLDTFTATAYTTTGRTSTGTYTTPNRTLAVNPYVIPYGTHVWLFLEDGTFVGDYYAEDTGSNMMANPYVIDIYFGENMTEECMQWGAQRVIAYVQA